MNPAIRMKLSVMMFLEYVIYGAWLPLLGLYLGNQYLNFNEWQQSWVFNAFAIAALTGMFFGGQLADRYFAQEKFLAFSHLIGGLAMLGLAYQKDFLAVLRPDAPSLFLLCADDVGDQCDRVCQRQGRPEGLRLHPRLGHDRLDRGKLAVHLHSDRLGEAAAHGQAPSVLVLAGHRTRNAQDRQGDGNRARDHVSPSRESPRCSSRRSAWSCRTRRLPRAEGVELCAVQGVQAAGCSQHSRSCSSSRSSIRWCITPISSGPVATSPSSACRKTGSRPAMSIGQVAEIATMAFLGLVLKRLGWRLTMIFGILGHVVRFGIYSIGSPDLLWLVILSNIVHGFAYAFFFATVYIYVDENFPKDVRTSAQSLFNLLILGLGPLASNFLSGWLLASTRRSRWSTARK